MIVALIIVDHVKTANGLENRNCSTKKGIIMEWKRIDINRYDENYMTHSDSLILIPVLLFPIGSGNKQILLFVSITLLCFFICARLTG